MQTMREEGLTEALTNDRHFEQEGFRALFRDSQKTAFVKRRKTKTRAYVFSGSSSISTEGL